MWIWFYLSLLLSPCPRPPFDFRTGSVHAAVTSCSFGVLPPLSCWGVQWLLEPNVRPSPRTQSPRRSRWGWPVRRRRGGARGMRTGRASQAAWVRGCRRFASATGFMQNSRLYGTGEWPFIYFVSAGRFTLAPPFVDFCNYLFDHWLSYWGLKLHFAVLT